MPAIATSKLWAPTTEAPVVEPEPAPDSRLDRLLMLIESQQQTIASISDRLATLEQGRPRFVPQKKQDTHPTRDTYMPPADLLKRARALLKKAGDSVGGRLNYLEDPEFARKLPPAYRPIFRSGDIVHINPDATIHGSDKNWGEVLTAHKIIGTGEILAVQYITGNYEPKYTVAVPGLTRPEGDGFRESELLPGEADDAA